MPNGGVHHCASCKHFDSKEKVCSLRTFPIGVTHWTTCRDINRNVTKPNGPIYSIICEVNNKGGSYCDIPWFDGKRVDTEQAPNGGDTIVVAMDRDGHRHEFPDAKSYMVFWNENTPEKEK